MNWYYVDGGQQAGPVTQEQFDELVRSGKITPETLVWTDGMEDWQTYKQATTPKPAAPPPPTGPVEESPQAVCAECGKMFAINEMIRHKGSYVCAGCKPVFVQKIQEGAAIDSTGEMRYAGFWIRFAAVFLDSLILGAVNMVLAFFGGLAMAPAANEPVAMIVIQLVLVAIQLAVGLSYEAFMIGKYGATLGKMACKIKVVTADGQPVSYGRAIGRYFAKMLSGFICAIGYIIAAFDDEKRALHDHICNTRVVTN